jgi:hypothetical protein
MHLRRVLYECRARGYDFDAAWELAMRSLPRGRTQEQRLYLNEWKEALRWAKESFRGAYMETMVVPPPPREPRRLVLR